MSTAGVYPAVENVVGASSVGLLGCEEMVLPPASFTTMHIFTTHTIPSHLAGLIKKYVFVRLSLLFTHRLDFPSITFKKWFVTSVQMRKTGDTKTE